MKNVLLWAVLACCTLLQAQPLEKSLLWKISGNGISAPSYLFGTIHMSCDATLSDEVKKALEATGQLYLELDMDDPSLQMNMMQGMMLKDGKTLSGYLSADEKQLVDKFLRENAGAGIEALNTVKPLLVSMLTLPKLLDCPIKSIEQELMKVAALQSEEIFGLESVDAQLAALDAVPVEEQVKELIKSIKDGQVKDREELKSLIA
ncbi:MAG: TraB/GumN family protein, partial [Chitinophagaceae bacterium]